jgi:RNA polymerase sigma factor (sigma-70 family)
MIGLGEALLIGWLEPPFIALRPKAYPIASNSDSASTPPEGRCELGKLIDRVGAGDQKAAGVLYEQYCDLLMRAIRQRILRRNDPLRRAIDATDLAQETWMALFVSVRTGKRFVSKEEFIGFIIAIAKNRALKVYRANFTAQKRSLPRAESFELNRHDTAQPERDPAAQAAADGEVRRLVDNLPPRGRAVLLALRSGIRLPEIAVQLNVSLRTVSREILHVNELTDAMRGLSN